MNANGDAWREVGVLKAIARYPLKGAGGEQLEQARLGWHGLSFDRRYALQRENDLSGLPWASPREFPELVTWRASIAETSGDLRVQTPIGHFDIAARDVLAWRDFATAASALLGDPVQLTALYQGSFDSMPVSIISTATLAAAGELVGDPAIDWRRFRPNLVVDTGDGRPWPERKWLGRELRLGDGADATVLRLDRHTTRCEVVDLDPATGAPTYELFAVLRAHNRNRAGLYGTPVRVGLVAAGLPVYVR